MWVSVPILRFRSDTGIPTLVLILVTVKHSGRSAHGGRGECGCGVQGQSLPTVAYLFFFLTDSTDSPDCLLILLSKIRFYFLTFLFSAFSCWFRAVD